MCPSSSWTFQRKAGVRSPLVLAIVLAGCTPLEERQNSAVRAPTAEELQRTLDLVAAVAIAFDAANGDALKQALATPEESVGSAVSLDVACPAGGKLHVAGTVSARCSAGDAPGRCRTVSFMDVAEPPPASADRCVLAPSLVLDVVLHMNAAGDERASSVSVEGITRADLVESDGFRASVWGCTVKLDAAEPARTLTGTFCYDPVSRTF
jgi:hypothetical protein